jgi:hypothetical protein
MTEKGIVRSFSKHFSELGSNSFLLNISTNGFSRKNVQLSVLITVLIYYSVKAFFFIPEEKEGFGGFCCTMKRGNRN